MTEKDTRVKYGELVQKAWDDEEFKKKFVEDPEAALAEAGLPVEEGVTYKVIEAPKGVQYLVLPAESVKEPIQSLTKGLLAKAEQGDEIIPKDVEVRIVQNTDDIRYLILPMSPKSLTQAELKMVAGGDFQQVSSNVYGVTNGVAFAEAAAAVVEVELASTTTTFEFVAEVGVGVVAIGVIVLI